MTEAAAKPRQPTQAEIKAFFNSLTPFQRRQIRKGLDKRNAQFTPGLGHLFPYMRKKTLQRPANFQKIAGKSAEQLITDDPKAESLGDPHE